MTDFLTRPDVADRDARLQVLGVAAHLAEHFEGVGAGANIGDGVVAIAEKLQAFVDGRSELVVDVPDTLGSLLEDERAREHLWRDKEGDIWGFRNGKWALKGIQSGDFQVPPFAVPGPAFAPYWRAGA